MYSDLDELIDVCAKNMVSEQFSEEEARTYLKSVLPQLDYWKRYETLGHNGAFETFKKSLIEEINALHIEGMPKLTKTKRAGWQVHQPCVPTSQWKNDNLSRR